MTTVRDLSEGMAELVRQQSNTAVILERVTTRLESLEKWREAEERRQERESERTADRIDQAPESRRADLSLLISVGMAAFVVLSYVSQHWKP